MTQDQIILLLDLKDSKERGAASMDCRRRVEIADELVKSKLIERRNLAAIGPYYYSITEKGLKALEKTREKR